MSILMKYHVSKNLLNENDFASIQVSASAYRYGTSVGILPQGTYTITAVKGSSPRSLYITTKLNGTYGSTAISTLPYVFTADGSSEYIFRINVNSGTTWVAAGYSNIMLNTGSTSLIYEPYSTDVWHDLAPQRYTNSVWVDSIKAPRRYQNSTWISDN